MIGFYNYSVILTYIGLGSSVLGIFSAIGNRFGVAIICLVVSGICDMFDGKIARAMERTEDEKVFGIQIDSLCDMVCFGVFPVVLAHCMGVIGPVNDLILVLYAIAGVSRLGYFNVVEQKRQQETCECRKYYQGLPITSIAAILPVYYIIIQVLDIKHFIGLNVLMLVVGLLFIIDFKIKKPGDRAMKIILVFAIVFCYCAVRYMRHSIIF